MTDVWIKRVYTFDGKPTFKVTRKKPLGDSYIFVKTSNNFGKLTNFFTPFETGATTVEYKLEYKGNKGTFTATKHYSSTIMGGSEPSAIERKMIVAKTIKDTFNSIFDGEPQILISNAQSIYNKHRNNNIIEHESYKFNKLREKPQELLDEYLERERRLGYSSKTKKELDEAYEELLDDERKSRKEYEQFAQEKYGISGDRLTYRKSKKRQLRKRAPQRSRIGTSKEIVKSIDRIGKQTVKQMRKNIRKI